MCGEDGWVWGQKIYDPLGANVEDGLRVEDGIYKMTRRRWDF